MYSLISFLLGIVLKFTDDIIDLNVNTPPVLLEFLKGLVIAFHTYIGYGDFAYNLVVFILLTTSYFFKGIDCSYWYAVWGISTILCILSITPIKNLWVIGLVAALAALSIGIEATIFTEETSIRKILWSTLFGVLLLFIMRLPSFTSIVESLIENPIPLYKLTYFGAGYFVARAAVKSYMLITTNFLDINNHDNIKDNTQVNSLNTVQVDNT